VTTEISHPPKALPNGVKAKEWEARFDFLTIGLASNLYSFYRKYKPFAKDRLVRTRRETEADT
jgi:hypothetical protein